MRQESGNEGGRERQRGNTAMGGHLEGEREREMEQAGHRQCLHSGDHDFRAGLLHLPMLNRQLITTRLLSPGHWQRRQQQQQQP